MTLIILLLLQINNLKLYDLKKAIIKLKESPDLQKEYGKNALKAAIEKFNWNIQEQILLKMYNEIKL